MVDHSSSTATAENPQWRIAKGSHVCTQCGCAMKPKIGFRGSAPIEVSLWAVSVMPALRSLQLIGLIYTIWRCATKVSRCANCDSDQLLVPIKSVSAKPFLADYDKVVVQLEPDDWAGLTGVARFIIIFILFAMACIVFLFGFGHFVEPVKQIGH